MHGYREAFGTFFMRLAEISPDMHYVYSLTDMSFDYISPGVSPLTGYTPEKLLNHPELFINAIHPDDLNNWNDARENLSKISQPKILEYRIICEDGTQKWVKETCTYIDQSNSKNGAILGTITDTTLTKSIQANLSLRDSEIDIRNKITEVLLTRKSDDMYSAVLDIVLEATKSPYGIFGYINDDKALVVPTLTRKIWDQCEVDNKDIIFPHDQWGDTIWPQAIHQKKILYSNEISTKTPPGHIPVERNIAVPIIHNDSVIGLFHIANKKSDYDEKDIHLLNILAISIAPILKNRLQIEREEGRRTKAEQTLLTDRKRLLALLDGISDVIYVSDPETYELLHVNEVVRSLWSGKKYIGEKCYRLLQNRNEPCPFCTNEIIFKVKPGEAHVWEFRNEVNNRWYRCSDKAIRWTDGRMVRFEIASDITPLKNLEEQLKDKNEDLKRSNKELEQFAYVASHDLQEPLRMVASYTELLQLKYKDDLDEKANKYINYAVDGAKRMQQLINDLLVLSRVNTRGLPLEPVDCNLLLEKVLHGLGGLILSNEAEVITDKLPMVLGDENQLFQLFQNLISNGIKFQTDEKPIIKISAKKEKKKWVFTVRDNGIGIDPQFFSKIFIIFQRLHERDAYTGTGIGLAIAKKIVERHNGKIWVESTPGEGAAFHFTLHEITNKK